MLSFKLAYRNIRRAGIRTFLSVFALSFSFVIIIWSQGIYDGMNAQVSGVKIDYEIGGGQFWSMKYDPYDSLKIRDSNAELSGKLIDLIDGKKATPILMTSAAIFPGGRIKSAQLKGIDPDQNILKFPSDYLNIDGKEVVPGLIGTRMAKSTNLKIGDFVTVRFRDANDTFDAIDVKIVHIMKTAIQSLDRGQIWIPLPKMRKLLQMERRANIVVLKKSLQMDFKDHENWIYRDQDYLLSEIKTMVKQKKVGGTILYSLFLIMALIAIFDTQVLSVFKRRKEMGTLMALGMTRGGIIRLFTLEGVMHGILAWIVGGIYGIPLLILSSTKGIPMPSAMDNFGVALGNALYPMYSFFLLLITVSILSLTVVIVSYLPVRKIAHFEPAKALRGNT